MSLVAAIKNSWGWTGIDPVEVVGENDFGNLIVKDSQGRYWRICPEDCYCKVVAADRNELDALSTNQDFLHDWYVRELVAQAHELCGPLSQGRKYCLKIPGVLGGEYGGTNVATISLDELIRASGHIAEQLRDLPDGAQVTLKVVE